MTTTEITRQDRPVKAEVAILTAHFRKCRAEAIRKYKRARFQEVRDSGRSQALHYGRLVRKMEGRG